MSRYFYVSNGLRGCYMPDATHVVKCDTRRELKSVLESEAQSLRDAGYYGLSKREIARIAAFAWRDYASPKRTQFDIPIPCSLTRGNSEYALFVSHSTRADFLEWEASDRDY